MILRVTYFYPLRALKVRRSVNPRSAITGRKGNAHLASRFAVWIGHLVGIGGPGESICVQGSNNNALVFFLGKWDVWNLDGRKTHLTVIIKVCDIRLIRVPGIWPFVKLKTDIRI